MPLVLKKTRGLTPWQPGQSGNPKGRPVGSRNKLATLVFDEALASFEKRGPAAFEELANKDPARYLILMAQLIPQHFKHEVEHTIAGLSPEDVQQRLVESRAKLLDSGVDLDLLLALPAPAEPVDGEKARAAEDEVRKDGAAD
jgi:hypothetical protein